MHVAPDPADPLEGGRADVAPTQPLAPAALAALERAYENLVVLAALPSPAPDDGAGGGHELDWYPAAVVAAAPALIAEEPHAAGELSVHLEALPSRGFDRAAAFCTGGAAALERSAHLCVAEASSAALAPAHAPHVRRAYATHLWWQQRSPELRDRLAFEALQAVPEAGVLWRRRGARSDGAAVWFEYLDRLGAGPSPPPGRVSTASLALAATRTVPGALRWQAEPDVLDVLRSSLGASRERLARFWDGFSQARARLGRGPQGPGALGHAWSAAPPATAAWELTTSSLPRHLALPRPLAPTGAAYFVIEVDQPLDTLALRATCEAPASYVWSVARYGPDFQHISTVSIPFQERQRTTEQRITELAGVRHLLVSGTHLGGVDLAHPFDPDHEPFEPHSCSVYLTVL